MNATRDCFVRAVPGVCLELLQDAWAAWSPRSGETLLLNAEAAAVLELLIQGEDDPERVARMLAEDTALPVRHVAEAVKMIWQQLGDAGLIDFGVGASGSA